MTSFLMIAWLCLIQLHWLMKTKTLQSKHKQINASASTTTAETRQKASQVLFLIASRSLTAPQVLLMKGLAVMDLVCGGGVDVVCSVRVLKSIWQIASKKHQNTIRWVHCVKKRLKIKVISKTQRILCLWSDNTNLWQHKLWMRFYFVQSFFFVTQLWNKTWK